MNKNRVRQHTYEFHDILRTKIFIHDRRADLTPLENVFDGYMDSSNRHLPELVFEIGDFKPEIPANSLIIDRKTIINDSYIFMRDGTSRATWQLEMMSRDRNSLKARFSYSGGGLDSIIAPNLFPISFGLRPLVERFASTKGWGAVHGVGLQDCENRGILLTGPGGIQKTSIAMRAITKGWRYLGDERVFVGEGKLRSLFTQAGLFDWKLKNIGSEWVNGIKKYPLFLKMIGENRIGRSFQQSESAKWRINESQLNKVVILSHTHRSNPEITAITSEEAIDVTLSNSYSEEIQAHVFMIGSREKPSLLRSHAVSCMTGKNEFMGEHMTRLKDIWSKSYPKICYRLSIPISPSSDLDITELIESIPG